MGEIRKDNLHESLIEELNELANIDLSGKQDKTDESLLTESKDVIGAINELFQSANNGKELIANAIGEPLDSNDTFSAMSNDISSLLSTFKTNMMNNGVTVDSGDRFKSLIDKIATMVEEGSGKGIQFVRKDITLPKGSKWLQVNDLGFKANIVMYDIDTLHVLYNDTAGYDQLVLYPIGGSIGSATYSSVSNFPGGMYINENGFKLPIFTAQYTESNTQTTVNKTITIIAIGVGEEDTTLRDSLASILTDEGVSVTEEDDMASLISKVDEEFNDKETEINSLTNELAGKVTPVGNAVASNVLTGKTFINSTGSTLTGTMANNGTKTITPKASAQTLGAGYYDKITINGDADLVAANIVSGKNIFGVTGTATVSSLGGYKFVAGTGMTLHDKTVTKGELNQGKLTSSGNKYNIAFNGSVRVKFRFNCSSSDTGESNGTVTLRYTNSAGTATDYTETAIQGTVITKDITVTKGSSLEVLVKSKSSYGAAVANILLQVTCSLS